MAESQVLGIIPARGGSKGLPRKNILPLLGKPLIAWTIEQAKASRLISRTIVSTEDDEIAAVSKEYGADIPFKRPSEYAQDSSPTSDAVIDALDRLEACGEKYDFVSLLEPTSPLRKSSDIDDALNLLLSSPNFDALVSVGEVHTEHPTIVKKIVDGHVQPYMESKKIIWQRQQVDKAYFPYGVIYVAKVSNYRREKTFYLAETMAFFIERWQNYEVDDLYDLITIHAIMEHNIQVSSGH